eukprot:TRINITY_DN67003_c8_g4_i1.p2 TRINITY_DN67003_c8_g4~~TRINITY_DN67003_c8_g4_i1.p2  ORF type:complete len:104 (+),score=12.23 TRINITY_DN67003_c8_g4_i1:55-366(+)
MFGNIAKQAEEIDAQNTSMPYPPTSTAALTPAPPSGTPQGLNMPPMSQAPPVSIPQTQGDRLKSRPDIGAKFVPAVATGPDTRGLGAIPRPQYHSSYRQRVMA